MHRLCLLGAFLLLISPPLQGRELTVSAASSLAEAFAEIGQRFEAQPPATRVLLNVAGSGSLLQQIAAGAPVDVFASADQETMDQAQQAGWVDRPTRRDFAVNTLVLAVPLQAQPRLRGLQDLLAPAFARIAIGNPATVPAGRYARRALQQAALWQPIEGRLIPTQNVRQALDYLSRGEVDAAFVYATDVAVMADSVRIALLPPLEQPIRYPIAAVSESKQADEAQRFIDFVLAPEGQAILRRYGFSAP